VSTLFRSSVAADAQFPQEVRRHDEAAAADLINRPDDRRRLVRLGFGSRFGRRLLQQSYRIFQRLVVTGDLGEALSKSC
jgi:hypothetical protein